MIRDEDKAKRVADEIVSKTGADLSIYDDHIADPYGFNAAVSEASGSGDESIFDDDFGTRDNNDHVDPFETLPEWDIIIHNLRI